MTGDGVVTKAGWFVGVLAIAVWVIAGGCGRPRPVTTAHPDVAIPLSLREVRAERGTRIALMYSSNLQGEYEHCGCPSHPLGGLVRRATLIDQARADSNGVLIVDAGDMLLPPRRPDDKRQHPEPSEVERRARLIIAAYARMGYHAVLPAEADLDIGPAKLKQILKAFRLPAVASNVMGRDGKPFFERDRLVTVAGMSIGIFGVVQARPEDQDRWGAWGLRVADPTSTAREEVASLKARGAKMIVALLHLGPSGTAEKLLQQVPTITWAVQGHAGAQLEAPETIAGARLVEAMSMGKLAGRLDIHVVDGGLTFADKGERAQVLTIIADHQRQLADINKRAIEDKTDQLREYYKLRREGISAAITRETELARKMPTVVRGSWFENRIIPLDESIPDQWAVGLLVAGYNAENARRAARGLPVGIAMRDPRAPEPVPPPAPVGGPTSWDKTNVTTYAGSAACAGCHEPQWKVFQSSKHARALTVLVTAKRDRDPTCVGCHSTGFLMPGGTANVHEATHRLKDVGCESCHGPSLEHITSVDKKATTRKQVEEAVCVGCHTPDRTDGDFDYERFRKAILGPGHGLARGGV